MKKILFLGLLLFFGCRKEEIPSNYISIEELTAEFTGELQQITQLRLAFGKTVANALVHPKFRNYIKRLSHTDQFGGRGFNEIVFGIHQNDLVTENLTLKQLLDEAVDDEVQELFGVDFLDKVLKSDPLVTIKLPDIFYNFEWDEQSIIPMVSVKTPTFLREKTENRTAYQFYHHSGYGELNIPQEDLRYFCIVVKRSEDFLLFDENTLTTEKNLSIFEFLPQAEECWDNISQPVIRSSIASSDLPQMKVINKRVFFETYKSLCEFGHKFTEPCNEPCLRDCPEAEQSTTVVEYFEIAPSFPLAISYKSMIYQEGFHFALPMSNGNGTFLKPYTIIGYRKSEVIDYNYDFQFLREFYIKQGFDEVEFPRILFDRNQPRGTSPKRIEIGNVLFTDFPLDNNEILEISCDILFYDDIVSSFTIPSRGASWLPVNPSKAVFAGDTFINYCAPAEEIKEFGDFFKLLIKH